MEWEVEQNLSRGNPSSWLNDFFKKIVSGYLDSDGNELWVYNYNNDLPI